MTIRELLFKLAGRGTYPTKEMPTIVEGEIWGPVRYESMNGPEKIMEGQDVTRFHNAEPITIDGKLYQLSIIQKKSPRGYLITDPYCVYRWKQTKLQEQDERGGWIPGTEKGIYYRSPVSWRHDIAGTMIDGKLCHWIMSMGHLGTHFD